MSNTFLPVNFVDPLLKPHVYGATGNSNGITTLTTSSGTGSNTPVAAHNDLFVFVKWLYANAALTVTDTVGNSYIPLHRYGLGSNPAAPDPTYGAHCQWFYTLNTLAHPNNRVTTTFSSAVGYIIIQVLSFAPKADATPRVLNSDTGDDFLNGGVGSHIVDAPFSISAGGIILGGYGTDQYDLTNTFSSSTVAFNAVPTQYPNAATCWTSTTGPASGILTNTGSDGAFSRCMGVCSFV